MTAIEYMEKQVQKHRQNFIREFDRKAPQEVLENIKRKVSYYESAAEALLVGELVRCKDCKHYRPQKPVPSYNGHTNYCCRSANIKMSDDGFCSFGERKENG